MAVNLDQFTTLGATLLTIVLIVPIAMTILRMIMGPGFADRFIALDMLVGLAVAMAALISIVTKRREFLDVALGLAIVGLVGACAVAAFLEGKRGSE